MFSWVGQSFVQDQICLIGGRKLTGVTFGPLRCRRPTCYGGYGSAPSGSVRDVWQVRTFWPDRHPSIMSTRYDDLVKKMAGPDYYRYATELMKAGHDALPAVHAGMGHSNWRVRRACATVTYHVVDAESLQRLVLLTRDPKKKVRKTAVLSLGRDRSTDGENLIDAVPHLAYSAMNDPAVRVRRTAALMLAAQTPERRIRRIFRKILKTEQDPKTLMWVRWGLSRTNSQGKK